MTLQELLKAKDEAIEGVATATEDVAEATGILEAAQGRLADREQALAEANATEAEAHKALHDVLTERGHHYLTTDDGTVTIYHAIDEPPGWCAYQPIPGTLAARKNKAKV